MQREMVDRCLENYREYAARCTFIDSMIIELRELAEKLKKTAITDAVHITSSITGMPHSNAITDPTGRLAIKFADGYTPDYIVEIEKEIAELESERREKTATIIFVDAWLKALSNREQFVIRNKTIGGMFWRELIYAFKKEFGEDYSKEGLKRIRDNAMERIYKVAQ